MRRWFCLTVLVAGACGGGGEGSPAARGGAATTAGTTALVGAFRGPYTTLGVCGNCETQVRFLVEATGREIYVLLPDPVPGQERVQAETRCRAVGRWVDHPGSCGDGQCRSFAVEAVEPP